MSDDEEKTGIIHQGLPPVAYQGPPEAFQPAQFPQHGLATQYPEEIHPAPYQQTVYPTQQPVQQEQAWALENPPSAYLKDVDDSYYRCLCNTHVHKGVIAICVISIISSILELIFYVVLSIIFSTAEVYETIWPSLLNIIVHIMLLIGNRKKIKWLYYPYLIIHLIGVAGSIALAVFLIVAVAGLASFNNSLAGADP
jgi:hypothetical protein